MDLAVPPNVTDAAYGRIADINAESGRAQALRVAVEGGGCSGFQYEITLADDVDAEDIVLEKDGIRVLIDPVSLPFLSNATIDYRTELIGARFVIDNPNATASCGCGTSFSI